jgi:hypothetical protein
MSKFDTLFNTLVEAVPMQQPVNGMPAAGAQGAAGQPVTPNQQTAPKPATSTPAPTTPLKIDANNPIVKELIAANDPTKVITALQKLGLK